MSKIVIANVDKIEFYTTREKVVLVNSVDQRFDESKAYLLPLTEVIDETIFGESDVYLPFALLEDINAKDGVHVYFDLELYPFFQMVREIVLKDERPKGVLRYRRVGKREEFIIEDLLVITSLLGEPQDIKVKRTNHTVIPNHTIVTINFGSGIMAHLEFTISDGERIELEWSGIKNILEFNSEEMTPIEPKQYTSLPLSYSVDAIFDTAHKVDDNIKGRIEKYSSLLNGGASV
ncbi:hypothetical protein [Fredinandcohnia quinoae]|uniref:Uncharacterized protein n=1 Tax=Fredinandcohnia quinoae TaxID=2918902 RepID=A0AAW5E0N6_9BACI|nr:hypothetical protein [Fredinandcohnia sp. SECRCQ15]MCH1626477.1 hypothetical protein [Fredinandcohnia sp. SECRCQ15]